MKTFPIIVSEPKLPVSRGCRASLLFAPVEGDTRPTHVTHCAECGEEIVYSGNKQTDIVAAFCGNKDYNAGRGAYMPIITQAALTASIVKAEKSDKPKECPTCGGPSTRGKGFAHTDDCPDSSVNKASTAREARGNCPHCGGPPGKRRGWKHTDSCTGGKEPAEKKPPCEHCGGPAKGRGFSHNEGCKVLSDRAAQTAAKPKKKVRRRRPGMVRRIPNGAE